jgi:hypothetical protein
LTLSFDCYRSYRALQLNAFLDPICGSLIELQFDDCYCENIKFIVNKMKKLKTLQIKWFFPYLKDLTFDSNVNFVELKTPRLNSDMNNLLLSIINLEVLETKGFITQTDLEFIVRNMKKLKKLIYRSAFPSKEIIEHLKVTEENINKEIEIVHLSY